MGTSYFLDIDAGATVNKNKDEENRKCLRVARDRIQFFRGWHRYGEEACCELGCALQNTRLGSNGEHARELLVVVSIGRVGVPKSVWRQRFRAYEVVLAGSGCWFRVQRVAYGCQ